MIPSVYHSFKQYKNACIDKKTEVMEWDERAFAPIFKTPELEDNDAKKVVEMVWKRYINYSDSELVALTHRKGTPWSVCYVPEQNEQIPDEITAMYYEKIVEAVKRKNNL